MSIGGKNSSYGTRGAYARFPCGVFNRTCQPKCCAEPYIWFNGDNNRHIRIGMRKFCHQIHNFKIKICGNVFRGVSIKSLGSGAKNLFLNDVIALKRKTKAVIINVS